ncbi:MAG TPA: hypothetical protein VFB99_14195 [Vicinamibacterales bacterium]|nr:hypothetical protein [Vicinamibacterales bacterium]
MSLRVGRLLVATPITEVFSVAGLLVPALVGFATTRATVTARMFEMQAITQWSAPLAGFLLCVLGGWWVARCAHTAHERNGVVLGGAVAGIDLVLLVASGAPFGLLMVSSVASRIVGGYAGGVIARRRVAAI